MFSFIRSLSSCRSRHAGAVVAADRTVDARPGVTCRRRGLWQRAPNRGRSWALWFLFSLVLLMQFHWYRAGRFYRRSSIGEGCPPPGLTPRHRPGTTADSRARNYPNIWDLRRPNRHFSWAKRFSSCPRCCMEPRRGRNGCWCEGVCMVVVEVEVEVVERSQSPGGPKCIRGPSADKAQGYLRRQLPTSIRHVLHVHPWQNGIHGNGSNSD